MNIAITLNVKIQAEVTRNMPLQANMGDGGIARY